jgi:hypothetical protein
MSVAKLEIVSRILGHSSVAITLDVYSHIYDEEVLEEVELHGPTSDGQLALERALRHKDILKAQPFTRGNKRPFCAIPKEEAGSSQKDTQPLR